MRGQTSIEFMIIVGAVLFFFAMLFILIQENLSDETRDQERIIMTDIALSLKDEVSLATESTDGYYREFYIVQNIKGKEYQLNITDGSVYIRTNTNSMSIAVQNVVGDAKKGVNVIRKQDGVVYLNP
ncbi:MAG: hypothetical protein ABIE22_02720 [archaeon]